jgi:hypothetical protein
MYHLDVTYDSKTMSYMIINHKCTFQKKITSIILWGIQLKIELNLRCISK